MDSLMTNLSNKAKVLTHLKQGETITQKEAIELFLCYRLSPVIKCLRDEGYSIVTHMIKNSSGIGAHARYELNFKELL